MCKASTVRAWASEEFGRAELGDSRRVGRLVTMATTAAQRPSGRVSAVFGKDAERQGAYDFLESNHVDAAPIVDAIARSCAARSTDEKFVFVPVDGSSLTIVDHAQAKGFGHVGSYTIGMRGLKVLTAIAVTPSGTPIGVAHLEWWNRPRYQRFASYRPPAQRESQKWRHTIEVVTRRFKEEAPDVRLWFQLDREGDSKACLIPLAESGHWFTVRSRYSRLLAGQSEKRQYLHDKIRRRPVVGEYFVDVPRRGRHPARRARLVVRSGSFTVATQNKWNGQVVPIDLNVVWVKEVGRKRGQSSLDWTLLTNRPTNTLAQVRQVIDGYCQRWRIEEFHRSWKSGLCDMESSQLRGSPQVQKWATILAAVAIRAERLKYLARSSPNEPASIELSPPELLSLRFFKERQKKRTEVLPDRPPTIKEAVIWIAQIGGYIHRPTQGPPGIVTIQRGLERILAGAEIFETLQPSGKKR
jgi:hypothetical protein